MDTVPFVGTVAVIAAVTARQTLRYGTSTLGLLLRGIVAAILGASAVIFELVICEVLQWVDPRVRALLWRVATGSLLALIGFIVPAVVTTRYLRFKGFGILLYLVYLVLFHYASLQLPVDRAPATVDLGRWQSLRQDLLATVTCAGITTMALLCGISSVSVPYAAFVDKNNTTEADVQHITTSLQGTDEILADKQLQLNRVRLENSSRASSRGASSTNLVGKLFGALRPGSPGVRLRELQDEIGTLEKLRSELSADKECTVQRLKQADYFRTPLGRVHRVIYMGFALYCTYRLLNGYARVVWWVILRPSTAEAQIKGGPRDALVLALAATASRIYPALDIQGWLRMIGVFVSGAVFIAALSGILRTIYRVRKSLRQSATTSIDPLAISTIVGVYVLSVATTLRLSLPSDMSGPISTALASPLRINSVQLWNDIVLCSAGTFMIVLLYISGHLSESNFVDVEAQIEKYE